MIEKIAIKLFEELSSVEKEIEYEWSVQSERVKEHYRFCARACLKVMLEPTDKQIEAALNLEIKEKRKLNCIETYKIMIDTALK